VNPSAHGFKTAIRMVMSRHNEAKLARALAVFMTGVLVAASSASRLVGGY
jgi:hypothetical protein